MKLVCLTFAALLLAPLAVYSADDPRSEVLDRQWVALGGAGTLEYKTTPKGDRIVDFSHAGYMGGGVAIPTLPAKKEVAPSDGDDTAAIQAAIGEVSALPLVQGFRGAVLLKPGTFHCAKPITIEQDGVVLRGSGSGKDGTLIEMTGEPHTALIVEGPALSFPKETPAHTFPIADAYVPTGTLGLSVKDATGLAAGDTVRIRWSRTAKWIHFMGMNTLVRGGNPQTWMKDDSSVTVHRSIRSIDRNRITLDVPLTDTIDGQFLDGEPAVVVKTPSVKRLSQCGIESLQIVSPPHKGTLAAGKNISVVLKGDSEDCWVRDIVMRETLNNVQVWGGCRRITITGAHSFHNSTVEKGAGYPADISIRGSQVLVDRCTSHGLGGFYVATLNAAAMLNVVLNCTFEGEGSIQPHMHWSTGLLIDSCNIPDGRIDLINRHSSGSGHGWAIGWGIAWNCTVKYLQVQIPPGALNLAIGCTGEPHKTFSQEAFLSPNKPVTPPSLYLAQLRERLGEAAVKNIGH
ncbi:MAG: hypothetical protein NTW87_12010 [Planctomycetota bacterium]|nr:hypothetical protein [Planctomycetota bacterium]